MIMEIILIIKGLIMSVDHLELIVSSKQNNERFQ